MTQAGPVDLPGEIAALVALDEVVVHGWDLARATGQDYDPGEAAILACLGFAQSFEPPADADDGGLFGPPVPVPDDAPAARPPRRRHRPRPALDPDRLSDA